MGSALLIAVLLVATLLGGGSLVCARLRERGSWLERAVTRIVVGAAALPALQIAAYELVRLPIRPWMAVAVGLAGLPLFLREEGRRRGASDAGLASREPASHRLALLALAVPTFGSVLKGSLAFPSFEGRDPWGHALGAKYLLEVGIPRQPFPEWPILHYVDAYPPLFDALLAVACFLGGSVNAPLKVVAALAAGLALPAFYYLVLRLLRDPRQAAVATALWAVLPGNLTRHVWAHSLALVLTLAALHAALRLRESWRWLAPGAVTTAGLLLAAPTAGINGGALLLIASAAAWRTSRAWGGRMAAQAALGLALASVWYAPALVRHGGDLRLAMERPQARRDRAPRPPLAPPAERGEALATGGKAPPPPRYGPDDFLFFRPYAWGGLLSELKFTEEIVPIGLGLPLAGLALAFLAWGGSALLRLWLAAALAMALGPHLGLDFYTWRGWLLLCPLACAGAAHVLCRAAGPRAAPAGPGRRLAVAGLVALAAASCVNAVAAVAWDFSGSLPARSYWRHGEAAGAESPAFFLRLNPAFGMAGLAAALLGFTALERRASGRRRGILAGLAVLAHVGIAAPIRLRTLTHLIEPLGYASKLEYRGYLLTLTRTARKDRVFPLSGDDRAAFLIGMDRECRPWSPDERRVQDAWTHPGEPLRASDLVAWLRRSEYAYLVVDPSYGRRLADTGGPAPREAAFEAEPGLEPLIRLVDESGPQPESFRLFRVRPDRPLAAAPAQRGRGTMAVSKVKPVPGSTATAFPFRSP